MKGSARIIGCISGSGSAIADVTAKAVSTGALPVGGRAEALDVIRGNGGRTQDTGIRHFLYVTPTEPQHLVWLVPQVGIDYQIETSTDLHWQIK